MPYDNIITGKAIKTLRQEKGLSQEVVSGLADIPRSHLAMIESGLVSPKVTTLWQISDALGLRLSELIQMVEDWDAGE